jgi:hypothetical protein
MNGKQLEEKFKIRMLNHEKCRHGWGFVVNVTFVIIILWISVISPGYKGVFLAIFGWHLNETFREFNSWAKARKLLQDEKRYSVYITQGYTNGGV